MLNYIINLIFMILPPSPARMAAFKRFLLRQAGHSVADGVRMMRVRVQGTRLSVGKDSFIGDETMIAGAAGTTVRIGQDCDISSRVTFATGSHKMNPASTVKCAGDGYGKDITVGDGVWIGVGATILGGSRIGHGAMVAAGAVVASDIPEFEIWGGVPARFIKKR